MKIHRKNQRSIMFSYPPVLNTLPAAHQEAIARAFTHMFQGATPHDITVLSGGMSGAHLFKVTVADQAYVLRLVVNPTDTNDPTRHMTCLHIADSLGLAPAVYWTDTPTGMTMMAYVGGQALPPAIRADPRVLSQLGRHLRTLHSGPAFPAAMDTFAFLHERLALLRAYGPLPSILEAFLGRFDAVCATLLPHLIQAPCHNDLNPANILFDGERIWIVDWDTASMNDPFFDLATALFWFTTTAAPEDLVLQAYFQRHPSPWEAAKLELMKQVAQGVFGIIFLGLAAYGGAHGPMVADERPLPRLGAALQALATGHLQLHTPLDAYHFGLVIINEALQAQHHPQFNEALAVLTGTQPFNRNSAF
jgi:aminoglycoside phosphotransferase (APT) family kinase protein